MYEAAITEINVDAINTQIARVELQNRERICEQTVSDYVDDIDRILEERPIEICQLDSEYFLVNGYHRLAAYRQAYPKAQTVRAKVQPVETANAVRIKALTSNFDNGLQLSGSEKKANVVKLSILLNYTGVNEKEYVNKMVEITNLSRPTILRYTEEQRDTIKGRFARAISIKRLAGESIRQTAEALGVTRHVVEHADKLASESPFNPFPSDIDTLLSINALLISAEEYESTVLECHKAFEGESWCYSLSEYPDDIINTLEEYRSSYRLPTAEEFAKQFPESKSKERAAYRYLRMNCLTTIDNIMHYQKSEAATVSEEALSIEDQLLDLDDDDGEVINPVDLIAEVIAKQEETQLTSALVKLGDVIHKLGIEKARDYLQRPEYKATRDVFRRII